MRRPHIFPEIEVHRAIVLENEMSPKNSAYENVVFYTTLRLKGTDGKWYLTQHNKTVKLFEDYNSSAFSQALTSFMAQVYASMLFGVADAKFNYSDGSPLFELDTNQESEHERMNKLIGFQHKTP